MPTRLRSAVVMVAAAAAVTTAAFAPTLRMAPESPGAHASADGPQAVRMNHVQVIGTHNGYKRELQGAEQEAQLTIDPGAPDFLYYSHASIPDQLEYQNVRAVELDLLPDPEGGLYTEPLVRQIAGTGPIDDPAMAEPGIKVLHIPDNDYDTTCRTFVRCLEQVRAWSQENPRHVPIIIQMELKQTSPRYEDMGGAVSPPWDAERLDELDAEIRSVFDEDEIIAPDDVRRPGLTLEESVLQRGWPTLAQARGRVLFFFDNGGPGEIRDLYREGRPNLEGRPVFTRGPRGEPDAAITMVNDPRGGNADTIRELVEQGYIIRTRSDTPLSTAVNEEFSRVEIALDSGAQLITTDFPVVGMTARYDSDFVAQLPGAVPVRCNPVSAPPTCADDRLER